jgi:hypothetical protein
VAGSAFSSRHSWTPEMPGIQRSATTAAGGVESAIRAPSAGFVASATA